MRFQLEGYREIMSAVVLMAENWHPTVLQIVPFSTNNAKTRPGSLISHDGARDISSASRGFPVLAVTRSQNCDISSAKSKTSDSRPSSESPSVHGRVCAITPDKHKNKERQQEPEAHDPACYSVQDLNEQVINPKQTAEITQDIGRLSSAGTFLSEGSGTKRLPKPKLKPSRPNDGHRLFVPRNGVRRPVAMTPGEMELQKYKDEYAKEQAQKKRKYKLNVNQLPRSTTPINDHDPDRLNMKNVIAFLQTKATRNQLEPAKTSEITLETSLQIGKRSEPKNFSKALRRSEPEHLKTLKKPSSAYAFANGDTHYLATPSVRTDVSDNISVISAKTQDIPLRESNCTSVLSTHSSPALQKKTHQSAKSHISNGSRPYSDRSRAHSETNKSNKEFKLHRFLALAPNGLGQTTPLSLAREKAVSVQPALPPNKKSKDADKALVQFRSPRLKKSNIDTGELNGNEDGNEPGQPRVSRTANLVHRRLVRRHLENTDSTMDDRGDKENERTADRMSNTIRLPRVSHFQDELDSDSDIDDGMSFSTAATYNSYGLRRENPKEESFSLPRFMALSDINKVQKDQTVSDKRESLASSRLSLSTSRDTLVSSRDTIMSSQEYLSSQQNKTPFRKIHINLPVEDTIESEIKQHDIVRLTLRQERDKTREMSYMSDIAKTRSQEELRFMRNANNGRSYDQQCYVCDLDELISNDKQQFSRSLPASSRALQNHDTEGSRTNEHPRHITDVKISRSHDRHFIHPTTISVQQTTASNIAPEESVNNTLANSCIKVRKKLKAQIHNDNELE